MKQYFGNRLVELRIGDDSTVLVEVVALHQVHVGLVDFVHQPVDVFVVGPDRGDQDELEAVGELQQVELVLASPEVAELSGVVGVDLLDQCSDTEGQAVAVLDAVGLSESLVVGVLVDEVVVVDEVILLPHHELVDFPLHFTGYNIPSGTGQPYKKNPDHL